MSKLLKNFWHSLILITSIFILVFIYVDNKKTNSNIKISHLHAPVTSSHHYSAPHINATIDEDIFFALGYMHAKNQLWEMELQRNIAKGTSSAMLGETRVDQDKSLYRSAESTWDTLDAKTKSLFHHYVLGINTFLEQGKLPLPFKIFQYSPEPWTDIDSIVWLKLIAGNLQTIWREKLENELIAKQIGQDSISLSVLSYPTQTPVILENTPTEKVTEKQNINPISTSHSHKKNHSKKRKKHRYHHSDDLTKKLNLKPVSYLS